MRARADTIRLTVGVLASLASFGALASCGAAASVGNDCETLACDAAGSEDGPFQDGSATFDGPIGATDGEAGAVDAGDARVDVDGGLPVGCEAGASWSRRFGDPQAQFGTAIAAAPNGGSIVVASVRGTTTLDAFTVTSAGLEDVVIAKLTPEGQAEWVLRGGDAASQTGYGVAVDPTGSAIVVGGFQGSIGFGTVPAVTSAGSRDIFVTKIDATGNAQWTRGFGDASLQYARAVAAGPTGEIVVGGEFSGSLDFGKGAHTSAGNPDAFVAKLDAQGQAIWSRSLTGPGYQTVHGVAVDSKGNVYFSGIFTGGVKFEDAEFTGDGHYLEKRSPTGAFLWGVVFGWPEAGSLTRVAVGPDDHVVVYGAFHGSMSLGGLLVAANGKTSIYVAKFDPDANDVWSKRFGGTEAASAPDLAIDASGRIFLTGHTAGPIDFGGGTRPTAGGIDAFVATLDASGNHLSSKVFGNGEDQAGHGIAATGCGPVVTGAFGGTIDFGQGTLTSAGADDLFVARLPP
jgi:beta-propeller repeat-containing protein